MCRKRRIKVRNLPLYHSDTNFWKCDEARPFCNQCIKAARQCPGFDGEIGTLPFRSENKYAGGTARKPRKGKSRVSTQSPPHDRLTEAESSEKSTSRANGLVSMSYETFEPYTRTSTGMEQVMSSLSVSLEDQALANFARNYIDPPSPECHWTHMKDYRILWQVSDLTSTLGLSAAALSLATFSRARSSPCALKIANQKYIQALAKVRTAIDDMQEVTSDQFLLSVVLLSDFEVCYYVN